MPSRSHKCHYLQGSQDLRLGHCPVSPVLRSEALGAYVSSSLLTSSLFLDSLFCFISWFCLGFGFGFGFCFGFVFFFFAKCLRIALEHYLSMTGISLRIKDKVLKCCQPIHDWDSQAAFFLQGLSCFHFDCLSN